MKRDDVSHSGFLPAGYYRDVVCDRFATVAAHIFLSGFAPVRWEPLLRSAKGDGSCTERYLHRSCGQILDIREVGHKKSTHQSWCFGRSSGSHSRSSRSPRSDISPAPHAPLSTPGCPASTSRRRASWPSYLPRSCAGSPANNSGSWVTRMARQAALGPPASASAAPARRPKVSPQGETAA